MAKDAKPTEFARRIVAEVVTINGVPVKFWRHKRKWWFGCEKRHINLTPRPPRS